MSDRTKLLYWLELVYEGELVERPTSILAGNRRFGFNEAGELTSVKDRYAKQATTYTYKTLGTG